LFESPANQNAWESPTLPASNNRNGLPTSPGFRDPLSEIQNSYANASYQRQRQMTLGDLLLENRIVFLQGEIHTGNANELVMKLLYLQSENKKKPINFYLNSPGGDVIATLAIYDVMQIMSCPVATYCVGQAASGAAVLLAGGSKGKRFCLPHSRVMIHQPYGGVSGQVSDIEIQADEILRNRSVLNDVLARHSGKTAEQIAKDIDRDFFMTAEQAKEYGIVDEITVVNSATEDDDDDDDDDKK
jgi:ATP-dependent Clp protease protease subunit